MSGEGYSKIAKAIRDDIGMSKAQSLRVARTEAAERCLKLDSIVHW